MSLLFSRLREGLALRVKQIQSVDDIQLRYDVLLKYIYRKRDDVTRVVGGTGNFQLLVGLSWHLF